MSEMTTVIMRQSFIGESAFGLESTHPEVAAAMLKLSSPFYCVNEDGSVQRIGGTGMVRWRPQNRAQLSNSFSAYSFGYTSISGTAFAVAQVDTMTHQAGPYGSALPTMMAELILDEPGSVLALNYRRWVKTAHYPQIRWVADILLAHACAIEWPDKAWLRDRFAETDWDKLPASFFAEDWVGCVRLYEVMLAAWEDGNFSQTRPAYALPFNGLYRCIS
eukprot:SAG31_NODE_4654_length_3067_cov_2.007075_3_plen_219_part_00